MPFFIFFVNKPLTILPFLGVLILSVMISAINLPNGFLFLWSFIFLSLAFTIWYPFILFYYYFLASNREVIQIQGVNFSILQKPLKFIFGLHIWALVLATIIGIYFLPDIVVGSLFLFVYALISFKILEQYVIAKLVSEGIKNNINLKNLDINGIYSEIRNILTMKLIK